MTRLNAIFATLLILAAFLGFGAFAIEGQADQLTERDQLSLQALIASTTSEFYKSHVCNHAEYRNGDCL